MSWRRGFTLVELLIVVAVVGVIAAIAISQARAWSYHAKRAQVGATTEQIRTALIAYESRLDDTLEQKTWWPDDEPNNAARAWERGSNFDDLDFRPSDEAREYGSYRIRQRAAKAKGVGVGLERVQKLTIQGRCDLDGDGEEAEFEGTLDDPVEMTTAVDVY